MTDDTQEMHWAKHMRDATLREDFGLFVRKCFETLNPGVAYLPNWHIDLICEYLEACRKGDIRRLVINMPPRALKSLCVNVAWPAFLLGQRPAERIMSASYSAGLSVKHALDCRSIVKARWYRDVFPGMRIAPDQNEKHKFATTRHGQRFATSVGGTATGEGGNFLIVDDPLNPLQAMSEGPREQANEWFDQTFVSRLDDKRNGAIVVVMQRLHARDLTGHLLEKGGWEHLCLPAVAERKRLYHFGQVKRMRPRGEPLHPAREGKAELQRMQRELGSFGFAAQYQQNPLPQQAGMVERHWFRRYAAVPREDLRMVQSWDTAVKTGGSHDRSVCITLGERDGVHHVLDVQVMRAEYPRLKRMVKQLAVDWQAEAVLMEDKASGQSLLQDLRGDREMPPLLARLPKQDKVSRFAAVSAMIEAGQVALPKDAAWLAEFEREILVFPHGAHDDCVDALSQYLAWVRERRKGEHRIRRL